MIPAESQTSARLKLPYLQSGQMQKHVTLNEALTLLDALVHAAVVSRAVTEQPPSPPDGVQYLVPDEATGEDWSLFDAGALVRQEAGVWTETPAPDGMILHVLDEGLALVRLGGEWRPLSGGAQQSVDLLGVGTEADAGNPFSARLNSALWTARPDADGGSGDLRYVLNKQGELNVLSLLFQSAFAGRAELGLIGRDDLGVKVSADGETWIEAMRLDRHSGALSLDGVGPLVGGEALAVTRAFAAPPGRRRVFLIDDLIADLERAGVWQRLDLLYLLAAPDATSAHINWRSPGVHDLTPAGAPTFWPDSGYQGDGVGAHLTAGVGLNSLPFYQRDDATLFAWSLTDLSNTEAYEIGSSASQNSAIRARNLAGNFAVRANADNNITAAVGDSLGLFAFSRNSSSSATLYKDGGAVGSDANPSSGVGAGDVTLLRSGGGYSPRRIAAAGCGAALSAAQHAALHRALKRYLTAAGAL